jgi:hypothetical protein
MSIQITGPDIRKNQDPTYIAVSNHHNEEGTGHTNKRRNKTPVQEKEHINHRLYLTHIQADNEWGHTWNIIEDSIHHSLHRISEQKYRHINQKVEKLQSTTQRRETPHIQFHPRVINHTNITFTTDELTLLNKGMQ